MDNSIIMAFILLANIVAIVSTYVSFGRRLNKDKKILYTMISIGVVYIVTLIVYFFSSLGIANKEVAESSKNVITFSFVPVNVIILLPFLIRSFEKAKNKEIKTEQLNKRAVIVAVIAIILMVSEFFYFRNIQKGIINIGNQITNSEQNTQ